MLKLIVESKEGEKELEFEVRKLVNAGRSGRDAEAKNIWKNCVKAVLM